jgi:hypothetical protein
MQHNNIALRGADEFTLLGANRPHRPQGAKSPELAFEAKFVVDIP